AVRQPHARHFPKRGVGLFRRGRVHARAHSPLLRIAAQVRCFLFLLDVPAPVPDELVDSRQIPLAMNPKRCSKACEIKQVVQLRSRPDPLPCRRRAEGLHPPSSFLSGVPPCDSRSVFSPSWQLRFWPPVVPSAS